jgi:hypothetical protein
MGDALRTRPCPVISTRGVIQCATDLVEPLGAERGDEVAEVALRERGDVVGIQNTGARHPARRSELDPGPQSSDGRGREHDEDLVQVVDRLVAGQHDGESPRPIGVLRPADLAALHQARARLPAPPGPAAASSQRYSPHAPWRGRPIRRRRRRSQPHGERAQPAPRSNGVRVAGSDCPGRADVSA